MLIWFILGLVFLVLGAELLVQGASRIASAAGISPLIIGLTVVAFGTSAPELAVSVGSAWAGQADVAVGNVVGSNIFNVLLILGLSATITPLAVATRLVRNEVPLMIGLSAATLALAWDGSIGRLDGAVFVLGLVGYSVWTALASRRYRSARNDEAEPDPRQGSRTSRLRDSLLVIAGLTLLVLGANWLVEAAVNFARALGVSEAVVGLTIVSAGTSLPELATSVLAAFRGQRDIAVGNVVGSNLFNILGVLGVAGLAAPNGLPVAEPLLAFDLPVMLATAVACLPIFATGHRIDRFEGLLFLGYYIAYTVYLLLAATEHEFLAGYSWVMATFVVPLTAVTLGVLAVRSWRRHKASR